MSQGLLLSDGELEQSSVVANNTMNRERGLSGVNSYARELGFDPVARLRGLERPRWLDLCSGEGLALRAAAALLPAGAVLTGVDLVGPLGARPLPAGVELVTASLATWTPPPGRYDLITCVHGLHYIGDKLALLARVTTWLAPGGLFVAHLDPDSFRLPDGRSAARPLLRALRDAGYGYDARRHLLRHEGATDQPFVFPFTHLGADPDAGPTWTGQPGVGTYVQPR
ncbi:methyltransferase domain-containing protein [Streptacidiphilus anmyonensis]|uniref:methyltransferase domain-containing protein n=1 Tax=Streptacidiphilus anmyonensis TaxID=405782 RepID=UPI000A90C1F3|nr:methyltransferase domain-containing protein [Streptacidiphilus anmyonensis]